MSLTTEQYEKINHFMDASMSGAEMDMFEKELVANPEMRQQLDFEQSVRDCFPLKDSLKTVKDANKNFSAKAAIATKPPKIGNIKKWLSIGVAACILLAFVLFIFRPQPQNKTIALIQHGKDTIINANLDSTKLVIAPPKDSSKTPDLALLYQQYYKKDNLPETYPMYLADAFARYEDGDYSAFNELNLSEIPETRGGDDALNSKENILLLAHYYKGISYLENDNVAKAISNFNWVLKNKPDKDLLVKTEWYLGLGYLKENNEEKAVYFLNKVNTDDTSNLLKEKVKVLLMDLIN